MAETNAAQGPQDFVPFLESLVEKKGVLKDLEGISDGEMEAVYTAAYNLYSAGKYADAFKAFSFLTLFNPQEKKYWLGFGATQQMLDHPKEAVLAYSQAATLDPEDPQPPLHAADCYLALGNTEAASNALDGVIRICGDTPSFAQYRDRAQVIRAMIEEKMQKGS